MLQSNAELQVLAHTDRLTGVANRNQLDHQLAMEWQRHRREQKPIALLMIDADHFKAYNDCFGHLAGDRCLIRIAEVVQRTCSRPGDLLARFGGEEFVLLLPNTDCPGAITVAERVQEALEHQAIPHPKAVVAGRVSVSIGIASQIPDTYNTPQDLLASADAALYRADAGDGPCRGRHPAGCSAPPPPMNAPGRSSAPTPPSAAAAIPARGRFSAGRALMALLPLLVVASLPHAALAAAKPPAPPAGGLPVAQHSGPCNASTAISVGPGLWVVGDDEAKAPLILQLYRSGQEGPAVGQGEIPARAIAPVNDGHPELDLEASARIGPLVYWIGSHGAAEARGPGKGAIGDPRPNHRRLFATNLGLRAGADGKGLTVTVEPVGRPYSTLIEDLAADPRYGRFDLEAAARRPAKARGGLNIEGLAATPNGALLIGFRNPLPEEKALLAPLTNPNAVMAGEKARFGDPVLLDLGGLGIRSLEMVNGSLLIVAGPAEGRKGSASPSALYRWSGQFESPAVRLRSFPPVGGRPFNPEALVLDANSLVVLSDDGKLEGLDAACGKRPKESDGFRELRITPVP